MASDLYKRLEKIKWEVINEEHKFHNVFYANLFIQVFILELPKVYGLGLKNNLMEIKGDYVKYSVDVEAFDKAAEHFVDLVKKDPSFAEKINEKLFVAIEKNNEFSRKLLGLDFSKKTNNELTNYCVEYCELQKEMMKYGMLPVIMEFHKPIYSDFLTQLVHKKNQEKNAFGSVSEAVSVLSSFEGETQTKREEQELHKTAASSSLDSQALEEKLTKHAQEFGWLAYGYGGPAWGVKEYKNALDSLKQHLFKEPEKRPGKRFYEEKLGLNEEEKRFFSIARNFMKGKALRKEAMSLAAYASESLHKEIAKRIRLSFLQVRFMTCEEVVSALSGQKPDETELAKRTKHIIFGLLEDGKYSFIACGKEAGEYGPLISQPEAIVEASEIHGSCACPGNAIGRAKIINHPSEMHKMKKGDVLVSYATTPDIVSAMRSACAIITDAGGLTSHAAIVSRELNVPCVIGTKIATKWLKDGDRVDVDATNGVVRKLNSG